MKLKLHPIPLWVWGMFVLYGCWFWFIAWLYK